VEKESELPVKKQCELLGIHRSKVYYAAVQPKKEDLELEEHIKSRIDYWHTLYCYMGVRRIKKKLNREDGIKIGRKLVKRYMEEIGIYCVYPKPNLSKRGRESKVFPYLLRNKDIFMSNQVWAIDITYIPMGKSHVYLTAVIDWYSRFIVGWELSDTLEVAPLIAAVKRAVQTHGIPAIINSDQGSQFSSVEYINLLKSQKIRQSMDGKGRWVDNVVIERWFRSLKCEYIYINEYSNLRDLRQGIKSYINDYNFHRPHQNLDNFYPADIFANHFSA
jgi:putative transposase